MLQSGSVLRLIVLPVAKDNQLYIQHTMCCCVYTVTFRINAIVAVAAATIVATSLISSHNMKNSLNQVCRRMIGKIKTDES